MKNITMGMALVLSVSQALFAGPSRPVAGGAAAAIADMEIAANDLELDARDLDSFTGNINLHWRSHAVKLVAIKDELREIAGRMRYLESRRESLEPKELATLDRAAPLLRAATAAANGAIEHLNERQGLLWIEPYKSSAAKLADAAVRLVKLLREF